MPPPRATAAVTLLALATLALPSCQAYSVHRVARHLLQDAAPDAGDEVPPRVVDALTGYLDNAGLEAALRGLPAACPHLNVTVTQIGTSVKGAPLLAVSLAHAAGAASGRGLHPRPNVKYVAGLHGDEPSGRQLLLALAEYVCAHSAPAGAGGAPPPHARDERVAALLARVALHVAPALNPDGFTVRARVNGAGVDLNRDFPDPLDRRGGVAVGAAAAAAHAAAGLAPDPDADDAVDVLAASGKEQPETAAIMKWTLDTGFVASAALHEGAIVANYPWDGTPDDATRYAACPDDAAFRALAAEYAARSPAMLASAEFAATRGITNGAAWYPLRGGMQDWNYLAAGCFELTLELSEAKWPAPAALPGLFAENLAPLLEYPLVATAGARGVVAAPGGGPPPPGAAVRVRGLKGAPPVRPHPVTGAFWRPLAPGNYTLAASAPGWGGAEAAVSVRGGPTGGGAVTLTLQPPADGAAAATAAQPAATTAAATQPVATTAAAALTAAGQDAVAVAAHATPAAGAAAVQPRDEPVSPYTPASSSSSSTAAAAATATATTNHPRRAGGMPRLPRAPDDAAAAAGERAVFVVQGAVAVASAGCLALMARAASRRAAAVGAR